MGDDIQAIKAGILEIADILVINKADRPGWKIPSERCAPCSIGHPGAHGQPTVRHHAPACRAARAGRAG
jgi:LAO/AO transport system kinase